MIPPSHCGTHQRRQGLCARAAPRQGKLGMESSTVLAFRIFVMLACLIVVPLAAIFGSAFPDVVKSVLVDRLVAWGSGKSPETIKTAADGGFGEVTPVVALGRAGSHRQHLAVSRRQSSAAGRRSRRRGGRQPVDGQPVGQLCRASRFPSRSARRESCAPLDHRGPLWQSAPRKCSGRTTVQLSPQGPSGAGWRSRSDGR